MRVWRWLKVLLDKARGRAIGEKMKFTFNLNRTIQILATGSVLATQYSGLAPNPKAQAIVISTATLAASVAGLLAHFSNPDGTKAEVAYEAQKAKQKREESN